MKTFICNRSPVEDVRDRDSPLESQLMSIRRDLLMRTALLRMPEVLVAAHAATTNTPSPPMPAPAGRPTALAPKQRRRTKPRAMPTQGA